MKLTRGFRIRNESAIHRPSVGLEEDPKPVDRKRAFFSSIDRWFEVGFWIAGAICIGIAFGIWLDARWFQAQAARQLADDSATPVHQQTSVVSRAENGQPIGILKIPRLDLEAVVAEGSTNEILRRAVGHLPHSAFPETPGNVVIAGHRDTFFRPLKGIREGDEVRLITTEGTYAYAVEWTKVVDPDAVEVIADTADDALTLVTCYPFRWVGRAPQRFIVRAKKILLNSPSVDS